MKIHMLVLPRMFFVYSAFALALAVSTSANSTPHASTAVSTKHLSSKTHTLLLHPCTTTADGTVNCSLESLGSENHTEKNMENETPKYFQFYTCLKNPPSSLALSEVCTATYQDQNQEPVAMYLDNHTTGENSTFSQELKQLESLLRKKQAEKQSDHAKIVPWLLGASVASVGIHLYYTPRLSQQITAHVPLTRMAAIAIPLMTGGYFLLYHFPRKPYVNTFMGKANTLIPNYMERRLQVYYNLNRELYELDSHELALIENWKHIDPDTEETIQEAPKELSQKNFVALLPLIAEFLAFHGTSGTQNITQYCLPSQTSGSTITRICESVSIQASAQANSTPTTKPITEPITEPIAEQEKEKEQEETSQNTEETLSGTTTTTTPSVEVLLSRVKSSQASSCLYSNNPSVYAQDKLLYSWEGYINCALHGGGEACVEKYNCSFAPKNQTSCMQFARELNSVKEYYGYNTMSQDSMTMSCARWLK